MAITKCSNPDCPYNDTAYDSCPQRAAEGKTLYRGLCLNCIADEERDKLFMEAEEDLGWLAYVCV